MRPRRLAAVAALLLSVASASMPAAAQEPLTLTVMSFNIWGGGGNVGEPIDGTVAVIRAAGADLVGIQETRLEGPDCTADHCPPEGDSVAAAIAEALGFHLHEQVAQNDALWANAILSRYPIGATTSNDLGVTVDVDGRSVALFNIHLDDSPYQPYQLLGIEYGDAPFLQTEAQAIAAAQATRGPAMDLLSSDLDEVAGADAVFITGDFNEPSGRDWTEAAVDAGQQPIAVAWPTTGALEAQGFVDVFRAVHPDPVTRPAFTWTPTSEPSDADDHHDRIDFVFARGDGLEVVSALIVGEKPPEADLVVTPWPSDHRAVVATITLPAAD